MFFLKTNNTFNFFYNNYYKKTNKGFICFYYNCYNYKLVFNLLLKFYCNFYMIENQPFALQLFFLFFSFLKYNYYNDYNIICVNVNQKSFLN